MTAPFAALHMTLPGTELPIRNVRASVAIGVKRTIFARSELRAVTKGDPKLLQFVVGEVRQDIEVDVILREQPRVSREAKLFQPLGKIVHGVPLCRRRSLPSVPCRWRELSHAWGNFFRNPATIDQLTGQADAEARR